MDVNGSPREGWLDVVQDGIADVPQSCLFLLMEQLVQPLCLMATKVVTDEEVVVVVIGGGHHRWSSEEDLTLSTWCLLSHNLE